MIRYHARWVLPVTAAPVRDGTVVVDDGRIAWVGPRAHAPAGSDVELGDAIVIPGLVNAHVHLDLTAFAGVIPQTDFFGWVRTLVRGLAEASNDAALFDVARWTVADQLAHGVTTVAHTGPGARTIEAIVELGARGISYVEVFGPDPQTRTGAMKSLAAEVAQARRHETSLVRAGISPHAPYSVSDALYHDVAEYATSEQLPVAVHIAESTDESQLVRNATGQFASFLRGRGIPVDKRASSPVDLLDRTGILRTGPLCIHAIDVSADDIARLAHAGASVAHCPRANAWLGHGVAPLTALLGAGIRVGIGTDSAASNDGLRILAEAEAAAGDLTPSQRLHLATLGGARALGISDRCGALVPGYDADLAVFKADPTECDSDPAHYVLNRCTNTPALLTMVAGRVRSVRGLASQLDPDVVTRMQQHRARARAWGNGVAHAERTILDSKT